MRRLYGAASRLKRELGDDNATPQMRKRTQLAANWKRVLAMDGRKYQCADTTKCGLCARGMLRRLRHGALRECSSVYAT